MLNTSKSAESSTQLKKSRVGVDGDSKAAHNNKVEDEVDNEVENEVDD